MHLYFHASLWINNSFQPLPHWDLFKEGRGSDAWYVLTFIILGGTAKACFPGTRCCSHGSHTCGTPWPGKLYYSSGNSSHSLGSHFIKGTEGWMVSSQGQQQWSKKTTQMASLVQLKEHTNVKGGVLTTNSRSIPTLNASVNRERVSRVVRHTSVAMLASSNDWWSTSASEWP